MSGKWKCKIRLIIKFYVQSKLEGFDRVVVVVNRAS